ncbi:LuxR C-terminal-related transcriptional regulator [Bdellovibrio sp. BCCA]|uniref:LuxR C-terminal-related transcriptional regulator n=1 Tax=Bdellovibrio sp. BCCA TaxID=3136281 RepID=UPI0030F2808E
MSDNNESSKSNILDNDLMEKANRANYEISLELSVRAERILALERQLLEKDGIIADLRQRVENPTAMTAIKKSVELAAKNLNEIAIVLGLNLSQINSIPERGPISSLSSELIKVDAIEVIETAKLTNRDLKICFGYFSNMRKNELASTMNIGLATLYVYECALMKRLNIKGRSSFEEFFRMPIDLKRLSDLLNESEKKVAAKVQYKVSPATQSSENSNSSDLSTRESEVMERLQRGQTINQISNSLYISEKTVKFHIANIYKKLNVQGRAEFLGKFAEPPEYPADEILEIKRKFMSLGHGKREVFKLAILGLEYKEIAEKAGLSVATAKIYISELARLFGSNGKHDLVWKFRNLPLSQWGSEIPRESVVSEAKVDITERSAKEMAAKPRLSNAMDMRYPSQEYREPTPTVEILTETLPQLPLGSQVMNKKAS